jgi:hypothetical protein
VIKDAPLKRRWNMNKISGYHHIFYHTGGGCGVGECSQKNEGYCCDDEYECLNCGLRIRFLSKPDGHFEMPQFIEGIHECPEEENKDAPPGKNN